ncbi:hypothetical protein CcaverHIS002_0101310 [Cutaneotrichosporon cavernicola]|uniref:non-specific serine/threonine protein kinase n=1 Tax=Cutaneotrichosporon cavernicola TaxID=279322 RepID=A0AA48KYC7_9TREE|nr:uncharacterized protein CcaverHIS019_0101290 [Cutaneotrichosporon cavernicola]BEI79602.1 hypothetical protein CcaverHIS002_0101310 [Cutaneotrichosporon cavernicola]BEI87411.1 hypothetical protein CcaverHIS019_0101290 [Cutaneotrichosporon cavernicola]BEI95179.1 hypothetical protein CcaverHIS631_0101280 [Cutaneotrichosporon cavernicola]BEJ02953.1 hypothetical protein CcaverHIS641_0101280 [Cutaneotrichosporon cavernicola]
MTTDAGRGMLDNGWWSKFTSDPNDYDLGGPVGFGASSTVYAAAFNVPNSPKGEWRECAVKVSSASSDLGLLSKEARLLSLCRHPNVLRVLATFTLPPDHARVAIVTPLIHGGSLAGILDWRACTPSKRRPAGAHGFDEDEIKAITKQVLDGLAYLHQNGFLHRDLKAGNFLIQPDGTVLLADFGVGGDINLPPTQAETVPVSVEAVRFDRPRKLLIPTSSDPAPPVMMREIGKRQSFVGTPCWMSPEVILGRPYDAKADIWSLGVTLIELASGSPPMSGKPSDILSATATGKARPTLGPGFSKHMRDFVDVCLQQDPTKRPTASKLGEHSWLRGAKKPSFLAESILGELPTINQRQELRRVSTMTSIVSGAPSWDFSFSVPPSPVTRFASPSVASLTAVAGGAAGSPTMEIPPSLSFRSRSQSRASSRGPSSPRISLNQWAERTSSGYFESMPPTPTDASSGFGSGFASGIVWPSPRRSTADRPRSGAAAAGPTTARVRMGKSSSFQNSDGPSGLGFPVYGSSNPLGAAGRQVSESPLRLTTTLEPEDSSACSDISDPAPTPSASASTSSHATAHSLSTPQHGSPELGDRISITDHDDAVHISARGRRPSDRKAERPKLLPISHPFVLETPLSRERTIASDMARSVSSSNGASGSGTPMSRSQSKGEKHGWLHFKHDRKDMPKDKDKDVKEHSFLGSLMARRSSKKAV